MPGNIEVHKIMWNFANSFMAGVKVTQPKKKKTCLTKTTTMTKTTIS